MKNTRNELDQINEKIEKINFNYQIDKTKLIENKLRLEIDENPIIINVKN